MSRKHYEAVARIIKARINAANERECETSAILNGNMRAVVERETAGQIAHDFAAMAASDNPKFNTRRFLDACGIK